MGNIIVWLVILEHLDGWHLIISASVKLLNLWTMLLLKS